MSEEAHAQPADTGVDLFPETVDTPPAQTMAEFTGTLVRNAEVRSIVLEGSGLTVPCLQMELMPDKAWPVHPLRVQQIFPANGHAAAEAAAHRYRKGAHITVRTPVLAVRLSVPNASHIHLDQEPQA